MQIPSNVRNHDLGEPAFRPFWAKAEALGVPVIVHPRGFTHDDRLHKFFLWNTVGQPLEEALAMASLIHEGILDAFPRLKVVISHGGGYPAVLLGPQRQGVSSRPETRAHIAAKPSAYMPRFFYDSVIFDQDMLGRLVHKVGAHRIMMGSDYPRGEIETIRSASSVPPGWRPRTATGYLAATRWRCSGSVRRALQSGQV